MIARTHLGLALAACAAAAIPAAGAPQSMQALVEAVRPALPFPAADAAGELPVDGGSSSKWFVVWPGDPESTRIVVKANPLHPEIQRAGADAMARIQAAVEAAERRAQAAYDRALEELKRSGKPTDLDGVTLDDEGVAGERIDAELELAIVLEPSASFETGSSVPPAVARGPNGASWIVTIEANTYRAGSGPNARERFRPAEARLIFGPATRPTLRRKGDEPHYAISVPASPGVFAVALRGNAELLQSVVATADWTRLSRKTQ